MNTAFVTKDGTPAYLGLHLNTHFSPDMGHPETYWGWFVAANEIGIRITPALVAEMGQMTDWRGTEGEQDRFFLWRDISFVAIYDECIHDLS
jgi:hypothetical protein